MSEEDQRRNESSLSDLFRDESLFPPDELPDDALSPFEQSVFLVVLKARYHLSRECINDILRLLRECKVDSPHSYKSMKRLVRRQSSTVPPQPIVRYVCPSCSSSSTLLSVCSACSSPLPSTAAPCLFFNFDLVSQIELILRTSPHLRLDDSDANVSNDLRDMVDGDVYQRLLTTEKGKRFLSLTMNIDGVQPNRGSDLSVWPIFLVINEMDRAKRFALENIILGGVWPGPAKPTREPMFLLFEGIVGQLKALEKGRIFELYSANRMVPRFLKVNQTFYIDATWFVILLPDFSPGQLLRQTCAVSHTAHR